MPRDAGRLLEASTIVAPVLAVGLGRGGNGKSAGLAEIAWRAKDQGRDVIVADGDARSQTLSGLFPDAMRPISEEIPDVKTFITEVLGRMLLEQRSAVLDLGGGDRSLIEFGQDLQLVEFCESVGIQPLAIFFLGPDPEDLAHVSSLWRGGFFRTKRSLLVFNAGVIRNGRTIAGAFDRTAASPEADEMVKAGAIPLLMKPLAVMDAAKAGGGLYAAADGKAALGPTHRHMVVQWLRNLEEERKRIGFDSWLP